MDQACAHWHVADLDGTYLFGYGRGRCRGAVAVYRLNQGKEKRKVIGNR